MARTLAGILNCPLPMLFPYIDPIQSTTGLFIHNGDPEDFYEDACPPTLRSAGGPPPVAPKILSPNAVSAAQIEAGARQAVKNCVKVKEGERVVIITDRETEQIAAVIQRHVVQVGASAEMFIMEDFGPRPEDGSNPLVFPKIIEKAMSAAQASFYIARIKRGELDSFRLPMTEVAKMHGLRHAHMPDFTEIMMSQGMAADYNQIKRLSRAVFDIVSTAEEIRVTSKAGTDAVFRFDRQKPWFVCDGDIKPDTFGNLPGGEVYTVPIDAWGRMVIDGGLGDFFSAKYGDLSKTPLSYELKAGRCIHGSVRCVNEELKREFEHYTFNTDDNSNRVGEFAIGTNIGITKIIGNLLQDEKMPGVHVALGKPIPIYPTDWNSSVHNDGMLIRPTITVDGVSIMEDGEFIIEF